MPGKGKARASTTNELGVWQCDCVKKLPDADKALEMLHEVKRHADALLKARGWRVKRLYEICCCTSGGRNTGVGGFCVPAGDGQTSLRIALRLRAPKSHELYPFDHNMRVMLHEMAHIVHGNHSAQFYQQMDELSKQYETLLAKGQVLDEKNMPIVGGRKADTSQHNAASMREARLQGLAAAERRAQQGRVLGGGGRLGGGERLGGGGPGGAGGRSPARWRRCGGQRQRKGRRARPRGSGSEAVRASIDPTCRRGRGAGASGRAAARADRCVAHGGLSALSADPPAATRRATAPATRRRRTPTRAPPPAAAAAAPPAAAPPAAAAPADDEVVDLTLSSDDEAPAPACGGGGGAASGRAPTSARTSTQAASWVCPTCTFRNPPRALRDGVRRGAAGGNGRRRRQRQWRRRQHGYGMGVQALHDGERRGSDALRGVRDVALRYGEPVGAVAPAALGLVGAIRCTLLQKRTSKRHIHTHRVGYSLRYLGEARPRADPAAHLLPGPDANRLTPAHLRRERPRR